MLICKSYWSLKHVLEATYSFFWGCMLDCVLYRFDQDLGHYYDLCLLLDYILEASSFYESFLKGCMLICNSYWSLKHILEASNL